MTFGVIVNDHAAPLAPIPAPRAGYLPTTPTAGKQRRYVTILPTDKQQHIQSFGQYFLIVPRPALFVAINRHRKKRQPGGMPRPKRSRITMPELLFHGQPAHNARPQVIVDVAGRVKAGDPAHAT